MACATDAGDSCLWGLSKSEEDGEGEGEGEGEGLRFVGREAVGMCGLGGWRVVWMRLAALGTGFSVKMMDGSPGGWRWG